MAEGDAAFEDLQAAAAHEFGHALGIQGHSEARRISCSPVEINHFNAMDQPLAGGRCTLSRGMISDC